MIEATTKDYQIARPRSGVTDGRYCIPLDGKLEGDWVTIHLTHQDGKPELQVAQFLVGPSDSNDDTDWHPFALVDDLTPLNSQRSGTRQRMALAKLLESKTPESYGRLYARRSGRCYLCGRKLDDEVSQRRGVDPRCASFDGVITLKTPPLPKLDPDTWAYILWNLTDGYHVKSRCAKHRCPICYSTMFTIESADDETCFWLNHPDLKLIDSEREQWESFWDGHGNLLTSLRNWELLTYDNPNLKRIVPFKVFFKNPLERRRLSRLSIEQFRAWGQSDTVVKF